MLVLLAPVWPSILVSFLLGFWLGLPWVGTSLLSTLLRILSSLLLCCCSVQAASRVLSDSEERSGDWEDVGSDDELPVVADTPAECELSWKVALWWLPLVCFSLFCGPFACAC